MRKWAPKRWNDTISVPIIVGIPPLLIWAYAAGIMLPEIIVGQMMTGWLACLYFYFRRAPDAQSQLET